MEEVMFMDISEDIRMGKSYLEVSKGEIKKRTNA